MRKHLSPLTFTLAIVAHMSEEVQNRMAPQREHHPEEQSAWARWTETPTNVDTGEESPRSAAIAAVKRLSRKILTMLIASSKYIIEERKEIIGERTVDDLLETGDMEIGMMWAKITALYAISATAMEATEDALPGLGGNAQT